MIENKGLGAVKNKRKRGQRCSKNRSLGRKRRKACLVLGVAGRPLCPDMVTYELRIR